MISVIVPVYNVEKYLCDCVDSILSQSQKDFELLLIDDGSTDGSAGLCDAVSKKDSRIRVYHKKNGGLSDARNYGIQRAQGQWLTFVDSDDLLFPDALEMMISLTDQYDCQMACCGFVRCDDHQKLPDLPARERQAETACYRENRMEIYMEGDTIGTHACAKLCRKELFENISFPVGKYHEDVFTLYRLVDAAQAVAVCDRPGYVYRQNPDSITMKFSPRRLHSVEGYLACAEFMEQNYPSLAAYAYRDLIYGCNTCVTQMARAGYRDPAAEKWMQKLYRRYGSHYCRQCGSAAKAVFVRIAQVNIHLAMALARVL